MASNPPAQCCTVGVKYSGEPAGKIIKIADKWDAYVASPPSDKAHADTAILYVPDVIGIWKNSQLMADQYAANGYLCMVLDPFNGDPVKLNRPADFDLQSWIAKGTDGQNPHTTKQIDPIVTAAIKTLQEEYGVKKLGAAGYCFGAKYVIRHYKTGIDVGYVAHPSFVEEEELAAITGPLSIAAAETDAIFPVDKRHRSEEILRDTKYPFQINLYSGVSHGFSVRGDPEIKAERFAKDQAFYQAIAWFDNYLL